MIQLANGIIDKFILFMKVAYIFKINLRKRSAKFQPLPLPHLTSPPLPSPPLQGYGPTSYPTDLQRDTLRWDEKG